MEKCNIEECMQVAVADGLCKNHAELQKNSDPLEFDFHYLLHSFYLLAGRWLNRLLDAYEGLFTLSEKDNLRICKNLVTHYRKKGDNQKAIALVRKAMESASVNQKDNLTLTLAELNAASGNTGEAKTAYKNYLQKHPSSNSAMMELANLYSKDNDFDNAIDLYEESLKQQPKNHETLYRLGFLYDKKKDQDKAVEYLESAIKVEPSEIKYYQLAGFIYESKGEHEKAVPHFKKVMELEHA